MFFFFSNSSFAKNSTQLLKNALSMTNKIGLNAYNVIMENDRSIIGDIVKRNSITEVAEKVFTGPPSHLFIARLAEISIKISTYDLNSSIPVCQFLPRFILFGEEPDILDFFQNIFSENPYAQHIQNNLLKTGFIQFLASSINKASETNHLGGTALYIIGLYKIIAMAAKSPIFGPYIQSPQTAAELLNRTFPNAPYQIKNARWKAILAVITPQNATSFPKLLDEAKMELGLGPMLFEYQIDAVHLLIRFASISQSVSEMLKKLNFVSVLGTILQKYPNHTIGHAMVAKAFRDTAKNPILGPHVYSLLPFIADSIINRQQIILSATSLSLLMELMNYAKSNPSMVQILGTYISQTHPCWNYARSAAEIFSHPYGGPMEETNKPVASTDTPAKI